MSEISNTTGINSVNDGLALAALVGSKQSSYSSYEGSGLIDCVIAGAVNDLRKDVQEARRDVKETEAEIRRDIIAEGQDNMAATKDAECHISKEILENKFALATAIQKAEYESKLAAQTVIKEINEKVDREAERTNDKVSASEFRLAEKIDHCCEEVRETLCAFEKSVDGQFCSLKETALQAENQRLRDALLEVRVLSPGPGVR